MVTPNQVLAYGILAGLGAVVVWTLWRHTRQAAGVEVREVARDDEGLRLEVTLRNETDRTLALEDAEVTKVRDGPGVKHWVVDVDDDLRVPFEDGATLDGSIRMGCVAEQVPDGAELRVLFVFRSRSGPRMAETWVEV